MANHLKMDKVFSILTLHRAGWSDRQIARSLGIHRETVGRHIRLSRAGPKPASNLPAGSDEIPAGGPECPLGRPSCVDRSGSTGPQAAELAGFNLPRDKGAGQGGGNGRMIARRSPWPPPSGLRPGTAEGSVQWLLRNKCAKDSGHYPVSSRSAAG